MHETRKRFEEGTDRVRLARRFLELAEDILPGEGFPDDEITDGMIRALCSRIGDREALMERVKAAADMWLSADEEDDEAV